MFLLRFYCVFLGIFQLCCCLCRDSSFGFNQKHLCVQKMNGFVTTWGRVINDTILILWWTIPLRPLLCHVRAPQRKPSSPEMYEKPLKALELLVARLGVGSGVRPTELGTISLVNSGSMCWRSAGPLWRKTRLITQMNGFRSNSVRWTRNECVHACSKEVHWV